MKRITISAVTGLGLVIALGAPASAETLRMLSSWSEADRASYAQALIFQEQVREIGRGVVSVEINGPEVVPPFEQLQPVSAGVFDILYTHGAYHAGSRGLALAADAIDADPEKRRAAGVFDFIDQFYQQNHRLKLLAVATQGTKGYHCYVKEPLSPAGEWRGRKIRGVVSYHGVIRALGGEPVVLPGGEVYAGLERGVVDGACWPAAGMVSMKHYEVAKYRMEPTFGSVNTIIAINLNRWNRLPQDQRQHLIEAGRKTELESRRVGDEIVAEEWAELARLGVEVTRLPPEKGELVQQTWRTSQWELAEKCCGDAARELREIARKAGLTN